MGSTARKLQTNQREKPRDLSVDFALPYPVECPALVTNDDIVRAYAVLFLPAFAAENVDSFDLQVQSARHELTGKTWQWYPVRRKQPSIAYVRSAVEAHLIAGETGEPCHLDGEGPIRAIGAKFRKDALTCILNVDLDGRYDVREVLRSFASVGVHGLLMSSSGRPGRYRFLVFLDRWYTIDEMQVLGKTLCESLGFKANAGGLEIYPSTGNGRLPGALGSLTRYLPTNLDAGTNLSLPEFLREMHDLPRVNIASIVDELQFSAERSDQDERIFSDIFPKFETVLLELEQPSNDPHTRARESRKRGKTQFEKKVLRWITSGVEPGERQRALVALVIYAHREGKNHGETVAWMHDLIVRGLLDRSNFVHEFENAIERQINDVPRIVTNIRTLCGTFGHRAVNAPLAHLSAEDLVLLSADVERVIALGKWTRACVERVVMTMLPYFKGACVDEHVDDQGRPIARIHWTIWANAAGKHADYVGLRDALGWFVPISDYLPRIWAKNPDDAHARTWAFVPRLTNEAPKRALGSSWSVAVIRARKCKAWKRTRDHARVRNRS